MQVVEKYIQRDHTSAKHTQVYIHTRVYILRVCVCLFSLMSHSLIYTWRQLINCASLWI